MSESCAEFGVVREHSFGDGSPLSMCGFARWWTDKLAGKCLPVAERTRRRRNICEISFSGGAMAMTMEQTVAQLQQEVFASRKRRAAEQDKDITREAQAFLTVDLGNFKVTMKSVCFDF